MEDIMRLSHSHTDIPVYSVFWSSSNACSSEARLQQRVAYHCNIVNKQINKSFVMLGSLYIFRWRLVFLVPTRSQDTDRRQLVWSDQWWAAPARHRPDKSHYICTTSPRLLDDSDFSQTYWGRFKDGKPSLNFLHSTYKKRLLTDFIQVDVKKCFPRLEWLAIMQ